MSQALKKIKETDDPAEISAAFYSAPEKTNPLAMCFHLAQDDVKKIFAALDVLNEKEKQNQNKTKNCSLDFRGAVGFQNNLERTWRTTRYPLNDDELEAGTLLFKAFVDSIFGCFQGPYELHHHSRQGGGWHNHNSHNKEILAATFALKKGGTTTCLPGIPAPRSLPANTVLFFNATVLHRPPIFSKRPIIIAQQNIDQYSRDFSACS